MIQSCLPGTDPDTDTDTETDTDTDTDTDIDTNTDTDTDPDESKSMFNTFFYPEFLYSTEINNYLQCLFKWLHLPKTIYCKTVISLWTAQLDFQFCDITSVSKIKLNFSTCNLEHNA